MPRSRYRGAKGNLRFPLDEPMPYALIARLAVALARQRDRLEPPCRPGAEARAGHTARGAAASVPVRSNDRRTAAGPAPRARPEPEVAHRRHEGIDP